MSNTEELDGLTNIGETMGFKWITHIKLNN